MSGLGRVFSLYRQILRTHQAMPSPMKELGATYAREEFRAHLRSEKMTEVQWGQFVSSWQQYVDSLRGDTIASVSGDLDEEVVEALSPDQRQQLERLKGEALRFRKDGAGESE